MKMKALFSLTLVLIFPLFSGEENAHIRSEITPVVKHLIPITISSQESGVKGIDCIYVINLDERIEKWGKMETLFRERGMFPNRVPAINGWKLSNEVFEEICGPYPVRLKGGEYGCYLSHLSVIKNAYDNGFNRVWICEDDIEFSEDYAQLASLIDQLTKIDPDWDVFYTDVDPSCTYLGGVQYLPSKFFPHRPDQTLKPTKQYLNRKKVSNDIMKIGQRFGMYSAILSKKGIKKIYDYFTHVYVWSPLDVDVHYISDIREYATVCDLIPHRKKAYISTTELAPEDIADTERPILSSKETSLFELAQLHQANGNDEKALEAFTQRAAMKGDEKEVFWSLYQIGYLQQMNEAEKKVFRNSYFHAYNCCPTRAEPLYRLAQSFRIHKEYRKGLLLCEHAHAIPRPSFSEHVEVWMYDWGIDMEHSLCAFYLGDKEKAGQIWKKMLENDSLPNHVRSNVENNLKLVYDLTPPPKNTPPQRSWLQVLRNMIPNTTAWCGGL